MPTYRIEVEERTTIIRETWIEAADEEEARQEAETQDWRTWSDVSTDTNAAITLIEEDEAGDDEGDDDDTDTDNEGAEP